MTCDVKIMIVDDHWVIREATSSFLKSQLQAEVLPCSSLTEATSALSRFAPKLILIDRSLPDGNGLLWAREYRKKIPEASWLGITGSDDCATAREVLGARLNGWVNKMCNLETIRIASLALLAGHSFYCAHSTEAINKARSDADLEILTDREIEIVKSLARGNSVKEIAEDLSISSKTVQNHITNIKEKLEVRSTINLIQMAWDKGWRGESSLL